MPKTKTRTIKGKRRNAAEKKLIVDSIAKMTTNAQIDVFVHYGNKKAVSLTLCGKPIPPAKTSPYEKDITCDKCKAKLNWLAVPSRPNYPNPRRKGRK